MYQPLRQNNAAAATLIVIAASFIAAATLFAKVLGSDSIGAPLHPLQISHGRFVFALLGLALAAGVMRPRIGPVNWRLHTGRTACGWAGITLMFAAVAYIPLSDATAISFLNPVFAMVLAIPLLGEKVGPVRWTAAGLAFLGALILLRPAGSFQPAALLALAAATFMGLELILMKRLTGGEGPFQILLVNNLIGVCIATLAVIAVWHPPTLAQWALLAALGLCMALAQTCFINAMARADASFVAPFSYATLLFAAAYDAVFFDVIPDAVSVIGTVVIVAGAVLLAVREGQLHRRQSQLPDR